MVQVITNQRQLAISQQRLQSLRSAAESAESDVDTASLSALASDIQSEILEFTRIRDGLITEFEVTSIDALGEALIKARIASGLNQRELAEEMEVSQQAVQKDESARYERASLARIAEIADALEHELVGVLRPVRPAVRTDASRPIFSVAYQGRVRPAPTDATQQNSYNRGFFTYTSTLPTANMTSSRSSYTGTAAPIVRLETSQ